MANKIYIINADFNNIKNEESRFEFKATNGTDVMVSVIAIPDTINCAVSVYQNREPLIINRIPVVLERIISENTSESIIDGDLVFAYTSRESSSEIFDINRLGKDLMLYYEEKEI